MEVRKLTMVTLQGMAPHCLLSPLPMGRATSQETLEDYAYSHFRTQQNPRRETAPKQNSEHTQTIK